jgi:hypothetical protein
MVKRNVVALPEPDWSKVEPMSDGLQLTYTAVVGTAGSTRAKFQTGTGVKLHRVVISWTRTTDGKVRQGSGYTRCGLRALTIDPAASFDVVTCDRCAKKGGR